MDQDVRKHMVDPTRGSHNRFRRSLCLLPAGSSIVAWTFGVGKKENVPLPSGSMGSYREIIHKKVSTLVSFERVRSRHQGPPPYTQGSRFRNMLSWAELDIRRHVRQLRVSRNPD